MSRLALVLLSGGLDSTTVAAFAKREGYDVAAVTFLYGQSHEREVDAARRIAEKLELRHQVVDVRFYKDLAAHSALTNPDRIELPVDRAADEMADRIPSTYVPLRNTFFLTLGTALLESAALEAIETRGVDPEDVEAVLFIAANAIDYSGYPDCRPEYYETVTETLRLGSKLGTQYGVPFRIETPLIDKSKPDIVRLAVELDAPIGDTWSCYDVGERPCGRCDSCLLRAKGFAEAGIPDAALAER